MDVPVIVLGEGLVQAVVEVLVVGEDDMATDVVQLKRDSNCQRNDLNARLQNSESETYETLRSDISAGKTTGLVRRVDNQP